jgi:hypothetical protein
MRRHASWHSFAIVSPETLGRGQRLHRNSGAPCSRRVVGSHGRANYCVCAFGRPVARPASCGPAGRTATRRRDTAAPAGNKPFVRRSAAAPAVLPSACGRPVSPRPGVDGHSTGLLLGGRRGLLPLLCRSGRGSRALPGSTHGMPAMPWRIGCAGRMGVGTLVVAVLLWMCGCLFPLALLLLVGDRLIREPRHC